MSYRRSPDDVRTARAWAAFVEAHSQRFSAAGLPGLARESGAHFDDLLMHGYFDHHDDPSAFKVLDLSEAEYWELVGLVERYFEAGYAWVTPIALRQADQQRLRQRFATPGPP